jgi:hypothetical protein
VEIQPKFTPHATSILVGADPVRRVQGSRRRVSSPAGGEVTVLPLNILEREALSSESMPRRGGTGPDEACSKRYPMGTSEKFLETGGGGEKVRRGLPVR